MTIEVDIEGRRYIEDRDTTAVLAGSKSRGDALHRALDASRSTATPRQPWRIAAVGARPG